MKAYEVNIVFVGSRGGVEVFLGPHIDVIHALQKPVLVSQAPAARAHGSPQYI